MGQKIDAFDQINDVTSDDQIYVLRGGTVDKTGNAMAVIEARADARFEVGIAPLRPVMDGISGGVLSRGSTTTIGITATSIIDSTKAAILAVASAYTKSLSAWALGTGNGGLDTGAIAANTFYAVFIIKRVDTGVTDYLLSLSATAPTMPASYTLFRRIGWIRTNGSSQVIDFVQRGRQFHWMAKVADLSSVTPGATTRTLVTLTAPANSEAMIVVYAAAATAAANLDVGWTALTDAAASTTNRVTISAGTTDSTATAGIVMRVQTDSSRQIYYRISATTGNAITILTQGWIDELSA